MALIAWMHHAWRSPRRGRHMLDDGQRQQLAIGGHLSRNQALARAFGDNATLAPMVAPGLAPLA
ncbi:MAG: hypothetical protein IPI03_23185 [Rubrivivax sp.]|nr:hypothetical protein [Rubrivivax sp.]